MVLVSQICCQSLVPVRRDAFISKILFLKWISHVEIEKDQLEVMFKVGTID